MMKKYFNLFSKLVACSFLFTYVPGHTVDLSKDCSDAIMHSFFPEVFVDQSLEKHHIPKEKWSAINKSLVEANKNIPKRVQEEAEKMNPNPFTDPTQRDKAKQLFRDIVQKSFTEAMNDNDIADERMILTMLDEITEARIKRVEECLKAGYKPNPSPQGQKPQGMQRRGSSDHDSDRDSYHDSEDDDDNDDDEDDVDHEEVG